ncbi:MAG: arsenate reductase (glutaredoxin) [Bacteroidia bacterium]
MVQIIHNSRCSKSREAYAILKEKAILFETIEYLKTPLSQKQITDLLKKLGLKAQEIIRKKENLFKEKFADKKLTELEWIKVLSENPVLIERPIVVKDNKAVIGRPTENVIALLEENK